MNDQIIYKNTCGLTLPILFFSSFHAKCRDAIIQFLLGLKFFCLFPYLLLRLLNIFKVLHYHHFRWLFALITAMYVLALYLFLVFSSCFRFLFIVYSVFHFFFYSLIECYLLYHLFLWANKQQKINTKTN